MHVCIFLKNFLMQSDVKEHLKERVTQEHRALKET